MKILLDVNQYNVHQWNICERSEGDWYVDEGARRIYIVLLLLMPLG
jgi:hypothetical protein